MSIFSKYKPFLSFLGRFFGSYIVLSALYQVGLNKLFYHAVDPVTQLVGKQSITLLEFFGYHAQLVTRPGHAYLELWFANQNVARIIEGCNGIAVCILFFSFIMAFKGRWKTMVVFSILGIVLIHLLNVGRISLLAYLLYHYPEHEHLLHGTIFPFIIYGFVFLMWVVWVTRFSFIAHEKK